MFGKLINDSQQNDHRGSCYQSSPFLCWRLSQVDDAGYTELYGISRGTRLFSRSLSGHRVWTRTCTGFTNFLTYTDWEHQVFLTSLFRDESPGRTCVIVVQLLQRPKSSSTITVQIKKYGKRRVQCFMRETSILDEQHYALKEAPARS